MTGYLFGGGGSLSTPIIATGTMTARSIPDRLAEIKNVLDYGADPTGVNDSRAAIQAAIDYTTAPFSAAARGIIFFPPGTYKIVASGGVGLTFNQGGNSSIIFEGCGDCSVISGSFAGPLLQRDLAGSGSPYSGTKAISKLSFVNGDPAGTCVRWGSSVGFSVRDCRFSGYRCLMMNDTVSFSSDQSASVDTCVFSSDGIVGAMAISCAGNARLTACDITGFDVGINMYSVGINVVACRFEVNTTAIRLALHEDGTTGSGMAGFSMIGNTFESNGTLIDFVSGAGNGTIASNYVIGFPGATIYQGAVVASTTITGAASGAVGTGSIASDGTMTITAMTSGAFQVNEFTSGTDVPSGTYIKAIPAGGHTGTYNVRGSPAYGLRLRNDAASDLLVSGHFGGSWTVAAIYVGDATNRMGVVFAGASASNGLGGSDLAAFPSATDWRIPAQAHAANWIGCNVVPTFLFSGLPTGANLRVGDTYYITDGNQATVGSNVTAGGGSNKNWVTWNGTNWIRGV